MSKTMNDLRNCFDEALRSESTSISVVIKMEGFPEPEVITNPLDNFELKLEYYEKTYNEDLTHKFAPGIQIIDFYINGGYSVETKANFKERYCYYVIFEQTIAGEGTNRGCVTAFRYSPLNSIEEVMDLKCAILQSNPEIAELLITNFILLSVDVVNEDLDNEQ